MASTSAKTSHLERTAAEPRDPTLNTVVLKRVDEINDQIRLFRLEIPKEGPPIRFLPGQWLDVFTPGVPKAGGFTITSSPSKAGSAATTTTTTPDDAGPPGYLELAVQRSPDNPPAAWLWQEPSSILGQELRVRVGGSFVWPPPGVDVGGLRRVVFAAGGVGINPLVSMVSALADQQRNDDDDSGSGLEVQFLYSVKDPGGERQADQILFLERLANLFARGKVSGELKLFLTGGAGDAGRVDCNEVEVPFRGRRMTRADLEAAVGAGPEDRGATVVYVCGVPAMTDDFVGGLTASDGFGMAPHMVLCEKWW